MASYAMRYIHHVSLANSKWTTIYAPVYTNAVEHVKLCCLEGGRKLVFGHFDFAHVANCFAIALQLLTFPHFKTHTARINMSRI